MPGLANHLFSTEAEIVEVYGTLPGYFDPVALDTINATQIA